MNNNFYDFTIDSLAYPGRITIFRIRIGIEFLMKDGNIWQGGYGRKSSYFYDSFIEAQSFLNRYLGVKMSDYSMAKSCSGFYIHRSDKNGNDIYLLIDGTEWIYKNSEINIFLKKCYHKTKEDAEAMLKNYNNRNFSVKQLTITNEDGDLCKCNYIISNCGDFYIHKDLSVHKDTCGSVKSKGTNKLSYYIELPGYYETKKEAQAVLDQYNAQNKKKLTLEERVEALEKTVYG